jgi:hypothetical protein
MKASYFAGLTALVLGIVACEPVFAIGWRELGIILLLVAVVFGPPVYRFLRRMEKYRKNREK